MRGRDSEMGVPGGRSNELLLDGRSHEEKDAELYSIHQGKK